MDDRVDACASGDDGVAARNIPADHVDANRRELRIVAAAEAANAIAARDELLDDISSEKSAAAGD
jgi:hypothetical protein